MATLDEEERRRGALNALKPANAVSTDPYEKYQGGVSFPTGPVSTTMPVPDPNKPAPNLPVTPLPSIPSGLTGQRDQWSAPANVAARGDFGRLSGFSNDMGSQTLKNQARNIFSGFDPTKGVGQLFADEEFKRLYPNATAAGEDKINWGFGDLPLDAIQDYGTPNAKWAWQPGEGTGAPASAAGGGTVGGMSPTTAPAAATPQSNIADIIAEITAIANQAKSPMERQALIDALLQQQQPEPVLVP